MRVAGDSSTRNPISATMKIDLARVHTEVRRAIVHAPWPYRDNRNLDGRWGRLTRSRGSELTGPVTAQQGAFSR